MGKMFNFKPKEYVWLKTLEMDTEKDLFVIVRRYRIPELGCGPSEIQRVEDL